MLEEYGLFIDNKKGFNKYYINITTLEELIELKIKLDCGVTLNSGFAEVTPYTIYEYSIVINDKRR